jgi:hypothetical protein
MDKKQMPGEPVFTLMGRDPQAPGLIRDWADRRTDRIVMGSAPLTDMEVVARARDMADAMETWRRSMVALSTPTPIPLFDQRNRTE